MEKRQELETAEKQIKASIIRLAESRGIDTPAGERQMKELRDRLTEVRTKLGRTVIDSRRLNAQREPSQSTPQTAQPLMVDDMQGMADEGPMVAFRKQYDE